MGAIEKLDVLAIAAHPDDVEIFCGGTVCLMVEQGYRVGIIDLTRGELGSRGSADLRDEESRAASAVMGVNIRVNLELPDGDISNTKQNQGKLVRLIRQYRPDIVLIGAPSDRHPDHGDATQLCVSSIFYAGLNKVQSGEGNDTDQSWRPTHVLHYMQSTSFEPDLVVDVSSVWDKRMKAVRAYASQIHDSTYKGTSEESDTFVSDPGFIRFIEARAQTLGYGTGASYGEGFLYRDGPLGVKDLVAWLGN